MINTQLSPPTGFQSSVQTTGSALGTINTACQSVMTMPDYSSPYAPSLAGDINNAKNTANIWNMQIRQEVMASLEDIVQCNSLFQSQFNTLYSISQQFATGDMSGVPMFQVSLRMLQAETQQAEQQVNTTQTALTNYLVQLDGVMRALNNDSNELQSTVNALNAQMQSLEQQMQATQKKIDDEKSNPFSELWYELTGQLEGLEKQQSQLNASLNSTNQQLQQAYSALNITKAYQNSFGTIQGGINGMANGWESLNADLNETLADENINDYNAFTPALVQAAASDWQQVATLAQSFIS